METQFTGDPSSAAARRMLDAAEAAEHATINPPLTWTYFVIQAVLLAVVCAAQMLPAAAARGVALVGIVAVVAVGIRWVFYRSGYGVVLPDGTGAYPYLIAMIITVGIPAGLALGFEQPWIWLVAAVCAAATTLDMGRRYRKMTNRA
ncbi:hypothetical protein [Micromonospora sp. RTGN7]|uniref:hypothetical protein n=1 Tax=Micromonospora sp. RTGN7 TaxID=3016526 RepID=UPI0029FF27BC|nr:hypothetical protein [Micromonospora sp. RTGN7]